MDFIEDYIWFRDFEGKQLVNDILASLGTTEYLVVNNKIFMDKFKEIIAEHNKLDIIRLYKILYFLKTNYINIENGLVSNLPMLYDEIKHIQLNINDLAYYITFSKLILKTININFYFKYLEYI